MGLSRGSIAFVAYSGDDAAESFSFVLLQEIPPGTSITFNDWPWTGAFYDTSANGGSIAWTSPNDATLPAGTVIHIAAGHAETVPQTNIGSADKAGFWDMQVGETIYANEGYSLPDPNDPLGRFLAALSHHVIGTPDPLEGTELTAGSNALMFEYIPDGSPMDPDSAIAWSGLRDVGSIDGATVLKSFHGDIAAALATYNSVANWLRDGGIDDGIGDVENPEGDPYRDPHSPLYGKDRLPVICFMRGTRVRTPVGEVAVEDLKIGDAVTTIEGTVAPVKWIGRQTISTLFADPVRVLPIRVSSGAIADNVPARDLLVSPDHALLVYGALVNAGALVNGTSITRERNVPVTFTYYHVELHDHSLILAENTPAETFIDNAERWAFDNWEEHEALYPDAEPIREMPYPRAKAARQVPVAVRARLLEQALVRASAASSAA
jgi:hypothetical protein